jgi:hypothetical protein
MAASAPGAAHPDFDFGCNVGLKGGSRAARTEMLVWVNDGYIKRASARPVRINAMRWPNDETQKSTEHNQQPRRRMLALGRRMLKAFRPPSQPRRRKP